MKARVLALTLALILILGACGRTPLPEPAPESGQRLLGFAGLSPAEVSGRVLGGLSTKEGLLLLLGDPGSGHCELILISAEGERLASGHLTGLPEGEKSITIALYGDSLIITAGSAGFAGDMTLKSFSTHILPAAGLQTSALLHPDLVTWYYLGWDGIYQYSAATGEHIAFAAHPRPLRQDSETAGVRIFGELFLTEGGDRLAAVVRGYETTEGVELFDLTPGNIVTRKSLDIGWGMGGGGFGGQRYFAFVGAKTPSGGTKSGIYSYSAGETAYLTGYLPVCADPITKLYGSYDGDILAYVCALPEADSYAVMRVDFTGDKTEQMAVLTGSMPEILGILPGGGVLAYYMDEDGGGFVLGEVKTT